MVGYFLQDLEKEQNLNLKQVSIEEILECQRVENENKHKLRDARHKAMTERGLLPHTDVMQEDAY